MVSLNIDNDLYTKANEMVSQPKYHELARDARYSHVSDNAQHEEGYDIFAIYEKLINALKKVPMYPAENIYEAIVGWNFVLYFRNI